MEKIGSGSGCSFNRDNDGNSVMHIKWDRKENRR